jgi:hypothetical protein
VLRSLTEEKRPQDLPGAAYGEECEMFAQEVVFILHQIEQVQRENPAEARRRAHVREALREPQPVRTRSLRSLISGLIGH